MYRMINIKAILSMHLRSKVKWKVIDSDYYRLEAKVGNELWNVSINDFPEEDMYSLFINQRKVLDFNKWPKKYWGEFPINDMQEQLKMKMLNDAKNNK